MNAAAPDKHVRAVVKIIGEMHERPSVGRGFCRLQPRDFESQIRESGLALARELGIRWRDSWEDFSRDGEALAIDEV